MMGSSTVSRPSAARPAPAAEAFPTARRATARPSLVPRRAARNFAALAAAEFLCRGASMALALLLAQRLGAAGFGRVEFALSIVVWLVLLVREGFDLIATREIARHPRLIRAIVNHVLMLRAIIAAVLITVLNASSRLLLSSAADRGLFAVYSLMLATTAVGLDYVFRGRERMGWVALSMLIRVGGHGLGLIALVRGPEHILRVPLCLIGGEVLGIGLIWGCYVRRFGWPRPSLRGTRFLRVVARRGGPVYVMQVAQAVLTSMDLVIMGLLSHWAAIGQYGASHRIIMAFMTLGLVFQQAILPGLARMWREGSKSGRRALTNLVRVIVIGALPVAVGTTLLAQPIIALLFAPDFAPAAPLLAVGIWRAPLLVLAFLFQTSLIALNRDVTGLPWLLAGVAAAVPLIAGGWWAFGPWGVSLAMVAVALGLCAGGLWRLHRNGTGLIGFPVAPLLGAAAVMAVVCTRLKEAPVWIALGAGLGAYLASLVALGGLRLRELRGLYAPQAAA